MRIWVSPATLRAILLVLATGSANLAWAQQPAVDAGAAETATIESTLQAGDKLEQQRLWGEALTLYEKAAKQFSNDAELQRRLRLSKLHYDLGRRFNDSTFLNALATLPQQEALELYSEVMLKIESHYVEIPSWSHIVGMGSTGLEVALIDPVFLGRYLQNTPVDQINNFRSELRATIARTAVRNRREARDAVNYAAWLANKRLGLPPTAIILEFVCGATNSLDDYTSFLTSGELTDVFAQIEGNFVGLGIELKAEKGGLRILRVITNSPAEKSGIRAGDTIVGVDGKPTQDLNGDQAADLLQGPEGTSVGVDVVAPDNSTRTLSVRREHVEVPSVDDAKILDPSLGVAYFKLTSFQKTTSKDMDQALWKLHREGMRSLIIDLRGNPGGLLTAAVEAVDKFVDSGVVVSTRGRNASEDYTYRANRSGTWRVPLVVLIDGDSASASEIFAGAIRDHRRGEIVGVRSYGKGSVQGIFSLKTAKTGIRLTTAKFYSPLGHPFSKVGVSPNIEVRQAAKPVKGMAIGSSDKDDAFISAALNVARNKMARRNGAGSNGAAGSR